MTVSRTAVASDTTELVTEAQSGDTGALDLLITGHLSLIYNIVGRALHGHPDVDDIVQNTMLRAIRALPSLREPERFQSWLVSIAYRQIQMHMRSRTSTLMRSQPMPVDVPDPGGDLAERTTAELVVTQQRQELAEAARWLDDGDRRLLALWWQEAAGELTRTELAASLAVKPKHAAVRVQRMKAQLDAARGIVRALRAKPRCGQLSGELKRWNGVTDPLWRKRLMRHLRDCPQCGSLRGDLVAPENLLLGVAALPVPVALLAGVKSAVHAKAAVSGTSAAVSFLSHLPAALQHKSLAAAAVATVAVGGGLTYAVYWTPATPGADRGIVSPTAAVSPAAPAGPIRASASSTPAPSATPTARPVGTGVQSADIYVAPNGSDTGDGSAARPYGTLNKAVAAVQPGQTIALRGGTYRPSAAISITVNGTAAKPVVLSNYRDERPVIDASAIPADQWAITQRSAYWTVQGLEVENSKSHAYVCLGCRNNVFRRLSMHDNVRSGLMLRDPGTTGNKVLDSDFFDNHDPAGADGEVGIGLGIQFGDGESNLVRGNRAFGNAAGGFDLGSFAGAVTLEHNWSYGNGVNRWNIPGFHSDAAGFALGGGTPRVPAAHLVRHNAAWDNVGNGFTDEGNTAALQLNNNTAFRNGGTGFALSDAAAVLRSNAAVDNATPATLAAGATANRNSWQLGGWTAGTFRSTDAATAEGPRTTAGALPRTRYLTTGNGVGASMDES